jgi:hypothetical protein
MKKQIIRLTEEDLNNIVNQTVNRIIKENEEHKFDYVSDILNASSVDGCSINMSNGYGEGEVEIYGENTDMFYVVKVYVKGEYIQGMKSQDYDVPDDPDETEEWIESFDIDVYKDGEKIGVMKNQTNELIKDMLYKHIEYDWSDYDVYGYDDYDNDDDF